MASENEFGRLVSIELHRYKWNYLFKLDHQQITRAWIDNLLTLVRQCDGDIYFKDSFIVIDLPLGYYFDMHFDNNLHISLEQIEYVDLGAVPYNNSIG